MAQPIAPTDFSPNSYAQNSANIAKFITLDDYINEVNMPDNRDRLVMKYGDQMISGVYGLLQLVGATKAQGTNDEVQWWEDTRLHNMVKGTAAGSVSAGATTALVINATAHKARLNDLILIYQDGFRPQLAFVTAKTTNTLTVVPSKTWLFAISSAAAVSASIVFNNFAQATNQPTDYILPNVEKLTNTFSIYKNDYAASGSAMTNKAWVTLPDGKQAWYWKGEQDFRMRNADQIEMMFLLGEQYTNTDISTTLQINGSEGYFEALENRGTVNRGYLEDIQDMQNLCKVLDKQGGSEEYAVYVSREQAFKFDGMLSATQSLATYGMFNNSKDMALELGFRGYHIGGRDFYYHTWKLLNTKNLLGEQTYYKGVMIPMDTILDSKTGIESPLLEINYKAFDGYSREAESWVMGAANGVYNDSVGFDGKRWEFRSEQCLVTRAAQRHVLIA